jgi:hypothetical protein
MSPAQNKIFGMSQPTNLFLRLAGEDAGMKNADEVLRQKELQLDAIRREVEALRRVASLLIDEAEVTKIPPHSEQTTERLEGTTGSAVTAPKFWPY